MKILKKGASRSRKRNTLFLGLSGIHISLSHSSIAGQGYTKEQRAEFECEFEMDAREKRAV
jgi:hypothetical protein